MNDLLRPLFDLFPAMWEKRWWGLAAAWAFALLGAIGVIAFKERYQASATVFVDTRTMLGPLLQGLTVQPDVNQQVDLLARTLLARPNINAIIDENHLLKPGSTELQRAELIQQLMKAIHVKINGRDNLYEIDYVSTDPQKTLGVVRSLLNLFVTQGIDTNRRDSAQAVQFIDSQIAIYDAKLRDAENKLKQFKTEHPGYSGHGVDYYARQSQLQDQLTQLQGQLSSAVSSRNAMQAQLADVRPTLAPSLVPGTGIVSGPSEIDLRIAAQRKHLDDLLQRYTDAYPDVVATRQTLARLERERQQQERQRASVGAKTAPQYSEATNPVYQQLRISLAQADANVASIRAQMGDVQSRLTQLRAQATQMPKLDEQYVQLNRDYTVLNDNYQKLVQRRESAMLSRNQDDSRKLDYFRVVDPPRLGPTALFPRRTFLIAVVLVLALGIGVVTSYLLVLLVPTYRTARQLRESTDRPVLGSITLALSPTAVHTEQRQQRLFLLGTGVLVVLFATWTVINMLHLTH